MDQVPGGPGSGCGKDPDDPERVVPLTRPPSSIGQTAGAHTPRRIPPLSRCEPVSHAAPLVKQGQAVLGAWLAQRLPVNGLRDGGGSRHDLPER